MLATSPQFRTKTGRLTEYSFLCGYIEQKSTNPSQLRTADLYTELYHEGACYHVRQFDRRSGAEAFRTIWECFDTLNEARDFFGRQKGWVVTRSHLK